MAEIEEFDVLQDRLRNNPSSLVFAHFADLFYQKEDFVRATQICEDGLARNPHYVNGHFVYGKCLLALNQIDRAEEEFNRVLLYDPEHLGAHFYLAQILRERGWDQAYLTRLETILSIDPLFEKAGNLLKQAQQKLAQASPEKEPSTEEIPAAEEEPIVPEEQPIFGDEDRDIEKLVAEHLEETAETSVEEPPVSEESLASEVVSEEPAPVGAEDESEKEKDFDYILDDIFEDEVMTEKPAEEEISSVVSSRIQIAEEDVVEEQTEPEPVEPPEEVVEEKVEEVQEEAPPAETEETPEEPVAEIEETPVEETPKPSPQKPFESYDLQEEKKETAAIVTPTLGEIYAAQGHYAKAIGVYEILLKKDPENEAYREKIQYLKKKLAEESGLGED